MDFASAKKEYKLLKTAYVTGAITLEEFCQKLDSELEVTAEDGSAWKLDEDTGNWLVYDSQDQAWVEQQPPGDDSGPEEPGEQLKVCLEAMPEPPKVPSDVYRAWKNQARAPEQALRCKNCGKILKSDNKFCTGCGTKF